MLPQFTKNFGTEVKIDFATRPCKMGLYEETGKYNTMVEWNLTVSENTANVVRTHLDQYEGDLNTFVEEAIQQRIFWETVAQIHKRNAGADPNEIERLVDVAVDWARAHRS